MDEVLLELPTKGTVGVNSFWSIESFLPHLVFLSLFHTFSFVPMRQLEYKFLVLDMLIAE